MSAADLPIFPSCQHSGDSTTSQAEVDKSTQAALEKIDSSFKANNAEVVNQLLERVVQVEPRLHRNLEMRS